VETTAAFAVRMTNYLPIVPPIAWAPLYLVNAFSYWVCGLAALLWSFAGLCAAYRRGR
jgi:hypothetical protein